MAGQFLPMVERDVHPRGPGGTAGAVEAGVGVPLLLARQEADLVGLAYGRQQRRVQRAPRADDLAPTGRVEAGNGGGNEAVGDPEIEFVWHAGVVAPGRQHHSIADRRGRLRGEQGREAEVVTYAVEVVTAVGAMVGVGN